MRLIDAVASHHAAIHAIVNDVIANTNAIYEEEPRTAASMAEWFAAKLSAGFPLLVAVSEAGEVLGFASYGAFNPKPGYRLTVEHSVHVAAAHRGRGVGRALLDALVARAKAEGLHAMVGLIDAGNAASRRLHESAGFHLAGALPQVGQKFGQWLDVCYYVRLLDASNAPA